MTLIAIYQRYYLFEFILDLQENTRCNIVLIRSPLLARSKYQSRWSRYSCLQDCRTRRSWIIILFVQSLRCWKSCIFKSLLDLHGVPVQYREIQGHESPRFLSYFPRFITLQGGVATGFHHVSDPPPLNIRKLYRITLTRASGGHRSLVVREIPASADSLVEGDVYILDKGRHILQYNSKGSIGQEKFKAAEFAQSLVNDRESKSDVAVYGKLSSCLLGRPEFSLLALRWGWPCKCILERIWSRRHSSQGRYFEGEYR